MMNDDQLMHKDIFFIPLLTHGLTFGWVSTPTLYFINCEMKQLRMIYLYIQF
jgi:hypothetical protein